MSDFELRFDHRGELDEVIVPKPGFVHFEMMDDDALWGEIQLPDGSDLHINIWVVNRRKPKKGQKKHALKYRAEVT